MRLPHEYLGYWEEGRDETRLLLLLCQDARQEHKRCAGSSHSEKSLPGCFNEADTIWRQFCRLMSEKKQVVLNSEAFKHFVDKMLGRKEYNVFLRSVEEKNRAA